MKAVRRIGAPRIPVPFAPPLETEMRVTPEKIITAAKAMMS